MRARSYLFLTRRMKMTAKMSTAMADRIIKPSKGDSGEGVGVGEGEGDGVSDGGGETIISRVADFCSPPADARIFME